MFSVAAGHVVRVQLRDVVQPGPAVLVAEVDRGDALRLERLAVREQVVEGLRHGDPVVREDLLVVAHELRVEVDRDAVVLAVVRAGLHRRRRQRRVPGRALADRRGQVERESRVHELLRVRARPGEVDVGDAVGRREHLDLVLVALIGLLLDLDRDAGVRLLELLGHLREELRHARVGELVHHRDRPVVVDLVQVDGCGSAPTRLRGAAAEDERGERRRCQEPGLSCWPHVSHSPLCNVRCPQPDTGSLTRN